MVLNNETPFLAVEKDFGPNLFVVLIHNSCNHTIDYNLAISSQLSRQINSSSVVMKFKQAIILNIFVTNNKNAKEDVKDIAIRTNGDNSNFIYNVYWNVNIDEDNNICEFLVEKNQPKKILNVYKLVESCCKDIFVKNEKNTLVEDITKTALEKSKKTLKSRNVLGSSILIIYIFISYLMLIPYREMYTLTPTTIINKEYYRIITSIFVNYNFLHVLITLVWLFTFATRVERYMGKKQLYLIFFTSAIVSNIVALVYGINDFYGSSGGVYGLVGAVIVLLLYYKKPVDSLSIQSIIIFIAIFIIFGGTATYIISSLSILTGILLGYAYISTLKS